MDESGDLGFDFTKKRSTDFFVITFLFVQDKRSIEKIVRRTHAELQRKYKRKQSVLHCYREKPKTRKRLLRRLAERECSIMTIYLDKHKVYTDLKNEKTVLYNFVANILLDRVYAKKLIPLEQGVQLVASKRETNKFLNQNFAEYLASQARRNHKSDISIAIRTPHEDKSLQAVDFVSWAIFRKYQYQDDSYYRIIKTRIIEESPLFP